MLNFKKIILHNFGSYGHAEVNVENRGICLVSGQNNYKKDNALSNGSGKSFLWSGICFALTGETISGLKSNLKNINAAEGSTSYVTVEFLADKDSYIITRHISPKSDLKIIKNDLDISGKGLRESEKKLGEVLPDLTKDLIASTVIIGQGMPNKFSSFSPSGRKDLLEKLTKSDFMVEDIRQRVNTRMLELQRQVRDCEDNLLIHKTQNKSVENTLKVKETELAQAVKPDFEHQLEEIRRSLTGLNQLIDEKTTLIVKQEAECTKVNTKLMEVLESSNSETTTEKEAYDIAFKTHITEKAQKEAELNGVIKVINDIKAIKEICPTCGQKLLGVVKPDTSAYEVTAELLKTELNEIIKKIDEINAKHMQYQTDIKAKYVKDLEGLKAKLSQVTSKKSELQKEIAQYTNQHAMQVEKYNKLIYDQEN